MVVTVDNTLEFTLSDSPYVAFWSTYEYPNNSNHVISAKAIDSSGNETVAQSIYVNVDNYYSETVSFLNTDRYVDSIGLAWDTPYGAAQFFVIRDGDSIASTIEPNFIDKNIISGTIYCYQIAAVNSQSISGPLSNPVCDKAFIAPPVNFTGSVTQDTIQLNWSEVVEAGQYRIYRNGNTIYTGASLEFLDDNLSYETNYNYTISCLDNLGDEGPQSNPLQLTTHIELLAPTLSISSDSTSFTLNWSSVSSATSYKIYVDDLPNSLETENTSYTYEGEIGQQNCFKIRAVNEHGTIGPESNQECATGN